MRRRPLAPHAFVLALAAAAPLAAQQGGEKLFFPACPPFAVELTFDCYHDYAEVEAFLRAAAERYPRYARLDSYGRSFQGRELWVLTITDFEAGEPGTKPAIWVDGGIDADEVVATEAALGLVHRLLTSDEPRIDALRRTRTFYIAPAVIPDASELHHTTPIRPRDTTLRPWDDDGDGAADEDAPDDLDGDRQALQMRKRDPTGGFVASEEDPRILRERRVGDAGPFYRVYAEGLDDDGDGEYNEDPPGGIDPNRNYPGNWSLEQGGNGPFPGSETELRALMDFAFAHPDIAATQHYHSTGGVILRPPSVPDLELPAEDLALYLDLSRRGLEVTGYDLATSVYDWNWPRGSSNRKSGQLWRDDEGEIRGSSYPAYGGSIDAMYLLFGALAFANEIWSMGEDTDGDGRVEPAEQLAWDDEHQDGAGFMEWTAFEHPQLGAVEIGGWRKFGQNNPLPAQLPEEVRRNVEFALLQAENTQRLVIPRIAAEDLGGGVWRVTATVRNEGRAPTELAIARRNGRATPVRVEIGGAGVEVLSTPVSREIEVLSGYSEEELSWVVRAGPGAAAVVTARHPKAGVASASRALR